MNADWEEGIQEEEFLPAERIRKMAADLFWDGIDAWLEQDFAGEEA